MSFNLCFISNHVDLNGRKFRKTSFIHNRSLLFYFKYTWMHKELKVMYKERWMWSSHAIFFVSKQQIRKPLHIWSELRIKNCVFVSKDLPRMSELRFRNLFVRLSLQLGNSLSLHWYLLVSTILSTSLWWYTFSMTYITESFFKRACEVLRLLYQIEWL